MKISLLLIIFLLIGFVAAQGFCVDFDKPSAPSNLAVTSSEANIILTWNAATDVPSCSGVDYYVVSRNGNHIAEHVNALTYTDLNVPYGTYSYSVYAVDKVAHQGGQAIKNDVVLSAPPSGGGGGTKVSGGGGAASYICYENWQCGTWSDCINGIQTRSCTDLNYCGTTLDKPATSRACLAGEETQPEQTTSFGNFFTGAVTGIGNFVKTGDGLVTFLVLITALVIGIAIITIRKSKLRLKNSETKKE